MSRFAVWILAGFLVSLGSSAALAKTTAKASTPSGQPTAKIKTIWDYEKELGLTAAQSKIMKDALGGLQKQLVGLRQQLLEAERQLKSLIEEEAPIEPINAKLQQISQIQVQIRLADIQTSRKINEVMEAEQLDKWRNIQKQARQQAKK
jgi:hypothetical protein